ncbi:hypothetical protein [Mycobacterium sp. URHB0021]|jgi:hypothetical protein
MSTRWRILVAGLSFVGWVAVLPAGIAQGACTGAGDYGAASGCAPSDSGGGSSKGESWPPTSVDWPPQQDADAGSDSSDKGSGDAQSTPIVMPDGQKPPQATHPLGSDSTSKSTPAKPIVPVGPDPSSGTSVKSSATTGPIVTPQG